MSAIRQPVLNIYLGTTACKVGEIVVQDLKYSGLLDSLDQSRVAHMFVDTATYVDGLAHLVVAGESLIPAADCYHIRTRAATIRQAMKAAGEYKADMYVEGHIPSTDDTGAGNVRNNGLAALCVDHQANIPARMSDYIKRISTGQGTVIGGQAKNHVRVNIVAYLGGGTGSGCLPAVTLLAHEALTRTGTEGSIRLFCIIPESIREAGGQLQPRAASNALACLVELVSMHIKDHISKSQNETVRLSRRVGRQQAGLSQGRLSSQVFLYNRTGSRSLDQVTNLVATDLVLRIVDGHGVGEEEVNELTNLRSLDAGDDKDQPTMFSCSCPLQLVFPARALARGFAIKATQEMLPYLTASPDLAQERISMEARDGVLIGARAIASEGRSSSLYPGAWAADKKADISAAVHANPPSSDGDIADWWKWLLHTCETEGFAAISECKGEVLAGERKMMTSEQFGFLEYDLDVGPLAQARYFAEARLFHYRQALAKTVQLKRGDLIPPERDPRAERQLRPRRGSMNQAQQDRFVSYLQQAMEEYLWYLIVNQVLQDLLEKDLIPMAETIFTALDQICRSGQDVESLSETPCELQGGLAEENLNRRSVLYVEGWSPSTRHQWCPPAAAIYKELMRVYRSADGQGFSRPKIEEITRTMFSTELDQVAQVGYGLLQDYLYDKFLDEFDKWNVVQVLERFVEPILPNALETHLTWVAESIRQTTNFDYSVVASDHLEDDRDIRLFIGIEDGGHNDQILELINKRLQIGGVARVCSTPDKHRISFLASWHGISLSMIPDYYQDRPNSPLNALLERIEQWETVQKEIMAGTHAGFYAVRPPFSCDAAAELAAEYGLPDKLER
ncbi:MAG: hypothetical protein JXA37_04130 [Chloroflexia bacterium]|nr:hypothetical protein [Chloroflexia bacterium]